MTNHTEVVRVYLKSYQNIADARNALCNKVEVQAISLFLFFKEVSDQSSPKLGVFDK